MEDLTGDVCTLKADTENNIKTGLIRAGRALLKGGIIAFPTETFYGLAVNALDRNAVGRLFEIKHRPGNRPVLILIPSVECLEKYVEQIPEEADKYIKGFWPGPLTLIFRAGPSIPDILTAGTGKIGVRLSSHPVAGGLARAIGAPITGTSANISGQAPCTNAREVRNSFKKEVDLILDGGDTKGEKVSTILDITVVPPMILREGVIGRKELGL